MSAVGVRVRRNSQIGSPRASPWVDAIPVPEDGVALVGWVGVVALAAVAPFETTEPLVRLPGQSLSNVEAALLLAIAAWVVSSIARRRVPAWRTPLTLPWLALVGVAVVSAFAASSNRANALHMAGRYGIGLAVFLLTVCSTTNASRFLAVLSAALVSGVIVSALAILEYLGVGPVLEGLKRFRPSVALVGAQVRAAGTLQYPTIASMYLEIGFAFGLGVLADAARKRRDWLTVVLVAALALVGEAIVLSFTRAGALTAAVSLVIVGGVSVRARLARPALAVALAAMVFGLEVAASRSGESMRVRLTTEGQEQWYRAAITAPTTIAVRTGETTTVAVRLTNTGLVTWDRAADHPFRFSYHWLEGSTDRVVEWEGLRTEFPTNVSPGGTIELSARVRAPGAPGSYRLVWDIEQDSLLWFMTEPGATRVETRAEAEGPVVWNQTAPRMASMPHAAIRPGRMALWTAALRMLAEHPITGVGPDNFRLLYARYAAVPIADPRVHSNNMYLEWLAGTGLAGGLAFAWFATRAVSVVRHALWSSESAIGAGVAAAVVAIAVHGAVDSFLGFTPTYLLISMAIGLATLAAQPKAYAHRV